MEMMETTMITGTRVAPCKTVDGGYYCEGIVTEDNKNKKKTNDIISD